MLLASAYLLGSIPFGWIITKILTSTDLRENGSGATGGTNVFRVLRYKLGTRRALFWAIVAAGCDVAKAYIPVRVAIKLRPNDHRLHLLVGGAATLGHTKPIFLKFQGGKAVSTTAGTFFAAAHRERRLWDIIQLAVGVFTGVIASSRIVSLGSITGSIVGGYYAVRLAARRKISWWYGLAALLASAYIVIMHKDNVKRMARREEERTDLW
ncbi:MAG: glycerol-3-phosphate acyltransferase [Candidatus Woykebacteria bacterium]